MRYKITGFQLALLTWISREIVVQSHRHQTNIIAYYKVIADAARDEFAEDNKPTLDSFLTECHQKALK